MVMIFGGVGRGSYHYIAGGPQSAEAAFNLLNYELKGGTRASVNGFIIKKDTQWDGDAKITVWDAQTKAPLFQFRKYNHIFWGNEYAAFEINSYNNGKASLDYFETEPTLSDSIMSDKTLEKYAKLFHLGGLNVYCANKTDDVCDGSHHKGYIIGSRYISIPIDPSSVTFVENTSDTKGGSGMMF